VRSIFFFIGIILIAVTVAAAFFRSLVHMEDHKPENSGQPVSAVAASSSVQAEN
jgi:hypothetical protein